MLGICVICGYEIKDMNDPEKGRADTMACEFHNNKWLCGDCIDAIRQMD